MAYTKTVWKARQGTNLNKFTKSEETETSVVLTNAPDEVSEAGTPFSAENMNHIEEGIAIASQDYSTEEQDTGIKWVDGKIIYRRIFTTISEVVGGVWGNVGISFVSAVGAGKITKAYAVDTSGGYFNISQLYGNGSCFITPSTTLAAGSTIIVEYTKIAV